MPRPVDRGDKYLPALDGLRAIAVALVIGYHVAAPGMTGGLLGVGVFFTLSGYLITSILLHSYQRSGGLDLRNFWIRRARRLLPAVIVVLLVVLAVTALLDREAMPARAVEAAGALFYVANWATIVRGISYFQRFEEPSPLSHLWSLAVEEQFYVVWPLLLLLVLALVRGAVRRAGLVTLGLAAASFVLLAMLFTPAIDNTRAYEGTDTRAGGLLLGAALAMLWRPAYQAHQPGPSEHPLAARLTGPLGANILGVLGLLGIARLVSTTDEYSPSLYRYGLLLLTVSTLGVIVAAVQPDTAVARALSVRPLTWLGERSYGVYLWHLPVIALMPKGILATVPWLRSGLAILITLMVATLSWRVLENPIRQHGLRECLRRVGMLPSFSRLVAVTTTSVLAIALVFVASYAGTWVTDRVRPAAAVGVIEASGDGGMGSNPDGAPTTPGTPTTGATTSTGSPTSTTGKPSPTTSVDPATAALKTSCQSVVHVGESTSLGFIRPDYVPNAGDRIAAQYSRVGVKNFISEIAGARSIIEIANGASNAQTVVDKYVNAKYDGCWVIAMGTNESANLYVGGPSSEAGRIDLLMQKIPSNQPVLWLTVKTLLSKGPYQNAGMQRFDDALRAALDRYPNLRIYDWASEVQDGWYIYDGIHFSTYGYTQRARRLANALAIAFPADGDWSSDKIVGSTPKQ